MIRRPPRSTPLSLHDALPISSRLAWAIASAITGSPYPRFTFHRPLVPHNAVRPSSKCTVVPVARVARRSEEHTSELQSRQYLVCRLLLEKKKKYNLLRHC